MENNHSGDENLNNDFENEFENENDAFYAEGIDEKSKGILEYVEQAESVSSKDYSIKSLLKELEKAAVENRDKRDQSRDPTVFMESEEALHNAIVGLSTIAASEKWEYSKDLEMLTSLIKHENQDIVADVFTIIFELLQNDDSLALFVDEFNLLSHLSNYLDSICQGEQSVDFDTLRLCFELIETSLEYSSTLGPTHNSILSSLYSLLFRTSLATPVDLPVELETHCTELIFAFLMNDYDKQHFINNSVEWIGQFLKFLNDHLLEPTTEPSKSSPEYELVANIYNCLGLIVAYSGGCEVFRGAEGVDLMLILIARGLFVRKNLEILDKVAVDISISEAIVEQEGLRLLFKQLKKLANSYLAFKKPTHGQHHLSTLGTLTGILAKMLSCLKMRSTAGIRLMAKFEEKRYEKFVLIIEIHKRLFSKVEETYAQFDKELRSLEVQEDTGDSNEPALDEQRDILRVRREVALTDSGVEALQNIDTILAFIMIHQRVSVMNLVDESVRKEVVISLRRIEEEQAEAAASGSGLGSYYFSHSQSRLAEKLQRLLLVSE